MNKLKVKDSDTGELRAAFKWNPEYCGFHQAIILTIGSWSADNGELCLPNIKTTLKRMIEMVDEMDTDLDTREEEMEEDDFVNELPDFLADLLRLAKDAGMTVKVTEIGGESDE